MSEDQSYADFPGPIIVDTFVRRWLRRAITITGVYLAWILGIAIAPAVFVLTFLSDIVRSRKLPMTRAYAFVLSMLTMEAVGLACIFVWWCCFFWRMQSRESVVAHFKLQAWWGRRLSRFGITIYGVDLDVRGLEDLAEGPILIFARHASFFDTLLPMYLVSSAHGTRLRYILKRELVWDPCMDIVGQRVPHFFVKRGTEDSEGQIRCIEKICGGLYPDDGVVIFPEGTRFTTKKQARILEKAATLGEEERARVAQFKAVLPPRLGGSLAMLETATHADAVFLSHSGLESATGLKQLLNGGVVGKRVHVVFRRAPRSEIPTERKALERWFDEQWLLVDKDVQEWESEARNNADNAGN